VRELATGGTTRRELAQALDDLASLGLVIQLRAEQYVLPGRTQEFTVGRLNMHRDGYGFVVADAPPPGVDGDVFLPPGNMGRAMHGDRVLARIHRVTHDRKADGEVIRVLERAHPTLVGTFHLGRRENYVVPRESRIEHWIIIPEGMEFPGRGANPDRIGGAATEYTEARQLDGLVVNVEITEYPRGGDDTAVGRVIEVLGHPDDFGVDVEITIRKHHLPHRFPVEVLEQARGISEELSPADLENRTDFRGLDIVTIDGETARDFDDAVHVERTGGGFRLQVHIADVSHYVRPGTSIDREALLRGTSVYFPDRAVPMLPLELSTGICSLKPQVDRLCMSAILEFDRHGEVTSQQFCRGVMRSVARMTYTEVHAILEGDAEARERHVGLVEHFERMRELALILQKRREKRGSIDFDLPEPLILFDENGEMTGIARAPRNIAHRIIEEFMLAANEAVSAHLEEHLDESIFRVHEVPDPQRVLEFEEQAARFGFSLGFGAVPVKRFPVVTHTSEGRKLRRDIERVDERLTVSSKMYQKLVAKIEGRPEERILNYLMLRSLKQARYSTKNLGHFALAAKTYTHFTSPIRRYPDLIVHRLLGGLLDGQPERMRALEPVAVLCSENERRAAEAERELLEWKKMRFMIDRVGDDFPALVISTVRSGFFVELDQLYVEGFVPIDRMPGGRWDFQENARKIVAERSRKELSIGDRMTVRLERVDSVEHRLQFSPVLEPTPGRDAPRKKYTRRRK
jgi:ribonuclease R